MAEYTTATVIVSLVGVAIGTLVLLGYLIFIWWLDRYEREPLWLVGVVFAYGALGSTFLAMILAVPLSIVAHVATGPTGGQIFDIVVFAPLVEELTKGLVFLPLILNKNFDNETDGLIYGAAVGLGFATVENLLYYVMVALEGPEALMATVVVRTLFSSMVHCISSALLGMCIGWVRHRKGSTRWIAGVALGYGLAVLNHALWNGLAIASSGVGSIEGLGPIPIILGMGLVAGTALLMLGITQFSLAREHALIRRHLRDEAVRGVLPIEHAEIVPYWLRRRRKGWLPKHVPLEPYVRAATLLAFRHHQLEIAGGERRDVYTRDIESLRHEIGRLLQGHAPGFVPAREVLRAIPIARAEGVDQAS